MTRRDLRELALIRLNEAEEPVGESAITTARTTERIRYRVRFESMYRKADGAASVSGEETADVSHTAPA